VFQRGNWQARLACHLHPGELIGRTMDPQASLLSGKPQPPPTMERLPQQMKCTSTLSQIGQVRYVSFAGICQTHVDMNFMLLTGQLLAKSPSGVWKRLNSPHLNNQESHNQNLNIYVDLNPSN